jgi:4-coumarate--CoA ligase
LVAHELRGLRPALYGQLQPQDLSESSLLRAGGLDLQSLDWVTLAGRVSSLFNLYQSGIEDTLLAHPTLGGWLEVIRSVLQAPDGGLTFATSGSSGAPKRIHHPFEYLVQEGQAWQALLPKVERVCVVAPLQHLYGFVWGVLLPDQLGVETIDVALADLKASAFRPQDLWIAPPPVWDYLAPTGWVKEDMLAISSTAPLSPATRAALPAVWEIYGSTETGGVGFRMQDPHQTQDHYQLLPHWARHEDGLARHCPDGEWRSYPSLDTLSWPDDQHFLPLKRLDDVIQIGGTNVSPAWVAAQIQALPNVRECHVRPFDDGSVSLKAFLVLEQDSEEARYAAAWAMREALPSVALPRHVTYGSTLPRNAMGKLQDWSIV